MHTYDHEPLDQFASKMVLFKWRLLEALINPALLTCPHQTPCMRAQLSNYHIPET